MVHRKTLRNKSRRSSRKQKQRGGWGGSAPQFSLTGGSRKKSRYFVLLFASLRQWPCQRKNATIKNKKKKICLLFIVYCYYECCKIRRWKTTFLTHLRNKQITFNKNKIYYANHIVLYLRNNYFHLFYFI